MLSSWDDVRKKYSTTNFMKTKSYEESVSSPTNFLDEYEYVYKLLLHPVSDGRHRILWLIIAPFCVNILKLSDEEAMKVCREYINQCKVVAETDADEQIEYHVLRARRINLRPPKLSTLKENHPDLYEIVKEIVE
jgi:hypothetical protein